MKLQEIQELAGHREVSPWVVKLVGDAVAKEREACAKVCDFVAREVDDTNGNATYCAKAIRARNNT